MILKTPVTNQMDTQDAVLVLHNNEYRLSSENIATGLNISHKTLINTIRKREKDLQEFGRVVFEKLPLQTNGGVQNITRVMLNENQTIFVATLSRNRPVVIDFKKKIVKLFANARSKNEGKKMLVDSDWVYKQSLLAQQYEQIAQENKKEIQELKEVIIEVLALNLHYKSKIK